MTGWELFEDMRAAQDEMLRAGRGRGRQYGQHYDANAGMSTWAPAVEITERADAYMVTAEVPGISAGKVEITFGDGLLTMQGERHAAHGAAGEKVHRSERSYGPFWRSITLPGNVQADKIEATARDGVLQVVVPKSPDVQSKRIPVQVGQPESASVLNGKANGS
jgi:HSP20 family protein